MTELETERLRLRRWRDSDLDALAGWNADPHVMRHMGRPPLTRAESAERLAAYERHWEEHGFGVWAAELRSTGELVGRIGPSFHSEWPDEPEVGWLIDPAHTGRGLATEGGRAALAHVFGELGFGRAVSICTPANAESQRVMEKLGFRPHAELVHRELGIRLLVRALDALPSGAARSPALA